MVTCIRGHVVQGEHAGIHEHLALLDIHVHQQLEKKREEEKRKREEKVGKRGKEKVGKREGERERGMRGGGEKEGKGVKGWE